MQSLYRCLTLQVGPHVMFCCPCIISSGISITCVIAHFVSTISADHGGKPHTYVREYSRPRARRCFVGLLWLRISYQTVGVLLYDMLVYTLLTWFGLCGLNSPGGVCTCLCLVLQP